MHGQPPLITYPQRAFGGGEFTVQRSTECILFRDSPQYFSKKYNGWMALIHLPTETMFSRHGELLTIGDRFQKAVSEMAFSPFVWVVAEALERRHPLARGSLFIIDWITPELSMIQRHQSLCDWFGVHEYETKPQEDTVYLIQQSEDSDEALRHQWDRMQRINEEWDCDFYEGFVATDAKSPYHYQLISPDKKSPHVIKYRWI